MNALEKYTHIYTWIYKEVIQTTVYAVFIFKYKVCDGNNTANK